MAKELRPCHSERSEESKATSFCELLRSFVPQDDKIRRPLSSQTQ